MVDINPNASGLQSQLQAQLQARTNGPAKPVARVRPAVERGAENEGQAATGRQLITAKARTGNLSTDAEIEAASARVASFGAGQREAPVGRLSEQAAQGRNVPLGQIIDIRV